MGIVHSILHTDMAKHNDSVGWLRSRSIAVSASSQGEGEMADADASRDLCGSLLHCADVGHPCLTWANHKYFSLLACTEFFNQFQSETRQGLPTLPFMNKDPDGPLKDLGPSQSGFVNFVVVPLFGALNNFCNGRFQYAVNNVQRNKQLWDRVGAGEVINDYQEFCTPIREGS